MSGGTRGAAGAGRAAGHADDRTLVDWRRLGRLVAVAAAGWGAVGVVALLVPGGPRAGTVVGIATLGAVVSAGLVAAVAALAGLYRADRRLAGDDVGLMPTPARRALARRGRRR